MILVDFGILSLAKEDFIYEWWSHCYSLFLWFWDDFPRCFQPMFSHLSMVEMMLKSSMDLGHKFSDQATDPMEN